MQLEELRDSRWRVHLEWMLENEPKSALAMHQQATLGPYLDQKYQAGLRLVQSLKEQGLDENQAFEVAMQELLAPEVNPDQPPEPLTSSQAQEIRASLLQPIQS